MSDLNPVAEHTERQLAVDGRSFWSNGEWVSSTSADGLSRWDGHQWVPQQRTFFQNVPDDPTGIDDRSLAKGSTPAAVKSFSTPTLYEDRHVAVGTRWLGMRTAPAGGWHLIPTRDIQSVAIVPPPKGRQIIFKSSPTTPKPFIAIKDRLGNVLSVNVVKFSTSASSALTSQLPADTNVIGTARKFLEGGGLPGQWGKKFNWFKSID
jgi:hypothetical protein